MKPEGRPLPRAGVKLWIERDEALLLSGYRADLLRLVQETGSLARAAAALGLSYRRAWGKLREIEENLGVRLVQSDVGGAGGGRSRLTEEGALLLAAWDRFSAEVYERTGELFAQHFQGLPGMAGAGSGQPRQQVKAVTDDSRSTAID